MEKFQAIQPSARLRPYIKQYWFISATNLIQGSQRVMPSGCTGLVFNREGQVFLTDENTLLPKTYIFGQIMTPVNLSFSGNLNLIFVIFQPIGARAFFNIPMNELYKANVGTDNLKDSELTELKSRLTDCTDNATCVYWIERYLFKRLLNPEGNYLERFSLVIHAISQGERDIQKLAGNTCLGYKQFKRLFNSFIGLNPKEYIRIARYSATIREMQTNPVKSLSELAFEYGYYDKSHLIKEIRSFSGYTPAEYQVNSEPYSGYKAIFQTLFVDIKQ